MSFRDDRLNDLKDQNDKDLLNRQNEGFKEGKYNG